MCITCTECRTPLDQRVTSCCRAKVGLPLVTPSPPRLRIQTVLADTPAAAASARIAAGDQPYLANVPLLQDSYLFGMDDWYSLVTTLLHCHWDSMKAAYSQEVHDAQDCCQDQGQSPSGPAAPCAWMSWSWLQDLFQGLNAQHRQVSQGLLPTAAVSGPTCKSF